MTVIFDTDKCDVPPLEKLPTSKFIVDCSIPAAPGPIRHCPDLGNVFDLQTSLGPMVIPPDNQGTNRCPPPFTGLQYRPSGVPRFDEFALPLDGIGFRASSSFYMWVQPSVSCPDRFNVLVDIGGGPPDSVFWQPPGGGSPVWTQCPILGQGLVLGSAGGGPGTLQMFNGAKDFALVPSSQLAQVWITPNNAPAGDRKYCYLYADAFCNKPGGKMLQLRWSDPGVSGTFETYSGGTVTVRGGLIVDIYTSGSAAGATNTQMGAANCDLGHCDIPGEPDGTGRGGGNHICPPGYHWDVFRQACVPDTKGGSSGNPSGGGNNGNGNNGNGNNGNGNNGNGNPTCPPGSHWDPVSQKCVSDTTGGGGGVPTYCIDGFETDVVYSVPGGIEFDRMYAYAKIVGATYVDEFDYVGTLYIVASNKKSGPWSGPFQMGCGDWRDKHPVKA